jgi:beta-N-acetylhexosaminidase
MAVKAFICGCEGTVLNTSEQAFLFSEQPWGLILFKRNIAETGQVRALVQAFRQTVGRPDAPVLIDQEGGRVQRMGPPNWDKFPSARAIGELYRAEPLAGLKAARAVGSLIAADLAEVGITVDCLPVLDVPQPGSHDVIGDRAYGESPQEIAVIARAVAEGLMQAGVLPVIKHMPGHGRAEADSHLALPRVGASLAELERVDFVPFAALADLPLAMTAHVVYEAIDADNPATLSAKVMREVVRGAIGYDGLVMTDDLSMQALSGSLAQRAEAAIAAGCDILLHCNGRLEEMREVAGVAPVLAGKAGARAAAALARLPAPRPLERRRSLLAALAAVGENA